MELKLAPEDIESIARSVSLKMAELGDRIRYGASAQIPAMEPDDALAVSYKFAGKLLGITDRMVFKLCQRGQLKAISIGRARRVLRSSIAEFLESQHKSA